MNRRISKSSLGFTIIEVLIVLAIAGLIILIMFLAVPALQRNSRNSQRSQDIGRIGAAIDECLTSHRNNGMYCIYDANFRDYIDMSKNLQLTKIDGVDILPPEGPQLDTIAGGLGIECNSDGTDTQESDRSRAVAIMWLIESGFGATQQRCKDIH